MYKVFFDTSVLFSAFYSFSGASAKLVSLVKSKYILGITTQTVIEELEENVHKIKNIDKKDIQQLIVKNNFLVRDAITASEIELYADIVDVKDTHVLAGAILTKCDYLVTLDKKHLDNPKVKLKIRKIKIFSPKELLQVIMLKYPRDD
ncbi:putative toxin-antitoxin system toxin component, PIN family [Candidatus Microgenomates bacterium]|nr:putative toxin-antitoxin system toxin component, PIN family [Candidatus Microgenomates bacterium]